ncbi:unnamed protein product, partial [Urochloa humidicola]
GSAAPSPTHRSTCRSGRPRHPRATVAARAGHAIPAPLRLFVEAPCTWCDRSWPRRAWRRRSRSSGEGCIARRPMGELRRLDKQGTWLRFLFHTRAPPTAPPGHWSSLLCPRKLKQAILAPLSRKDEDRPLLFVSRWDLGLWASKELAAKDQVIVKNGLKSGVQKRIFDNGESSGCAPSYFTAN